MFFTVNCITGLQKTGLPEQWLIFMNGTQVNFLARFHRKSHTYSVVGNMNQHQLSIGETTFGGRPELADSTGIVDYGTLIYFTLQRAKNAREAIVNIFTACYRLWLCKFR